MSTERLGGLAESLRVAIQTTFAIQVPNDWTDLEFETADALLGAAIDRLAVARELLASGYSPASPPTKERLDQLDKKMAARLWKF